MEAISVFFGGDGVEQALGVNVFRQRKLDEDAVDVVAGVELGDEREQFFGGDGLGRRQYLAVNADLFARERLVAYVDM
jgi:hypothetical protein